MRRTARGRGTAAQSPQHEAQARRPAAAAEDERDDARRDALRLAQHLGVAAELESLPLAASASAASTPMLCSATRRRGRRRRRFLRFRRRRRPRRGRGSRRRQPARPDQRRLVDHVGARRRRLARERRAPPRCLPTTGRQFGGRAPQASRSRPPPSTLRRGITEGARRVRRSGQRVLRLLPREAVHPARPRRLGEDDELRRRVVALQRAELGLERECAHAEAADAVAERPGDAHFR